ncbi:hypothetical protein [uncultured Cohaesibacter sp.]|uniref:hypothetical protein n=1 Tax=uncultured Cohaesibacter sp. TaxID=1002546 RepID=UPI0029C87583|nr:hypothetical protein [uncultured Cohaesibacter sp.]
MSIEPTAPPVVHPTDILSGLGLLGRGEICQLIALIECVDALFLAKGVPEEISVKLGLAKDVAADRLQAIRDELAKSPATDAALRFRLWTRMSEAMAMPPIALSLSGKHATRSAAAFAVRASERLTPSVRARHRIASLEISDIGFAEWVGKKAASYWKSAKAVVGAEPPLPFSQIVAEEILALVADDELIDAAAKKADPEAYEALRQGQARARNAITAGGAWVGGAVVVANAGFLPYMLAAQLSAIIPLVSGPALVSLLATLINPVTVFAGVAALGWLGLGRGSWVVRSQLAARLGVLMAAQGVERSEEGLHRFLADMRRLDQEPTASFGWMPAQDRSDMLRRLAVVGGRLTVPLPAPSGLPPEPWSSKSMASDFSDAIATLSMTAGEMLWHAAALDSNVMKAADFSRSEDIGDPIAFTWSAGDFMNAGAGWSLRGYTAERLVMDKLIADGHDVCLADASNTPGLDLIVDGMPVQVKCGTALSNLAEHFEKYPDIPVIANSDLAEKAMAGGMPWAHMVTTLPGFEINIIEDQITNTLGHAIDLSSPDILHFAISIGVLRGGIEVLKGRVPITDLPAWLLLDGASRGLLAFAGSNAGAWFGLVAIGPAGALILGPAIGAAAILGNSTLKNYAQKQLMSDWLRDLQQATENLHGHIISALEHRIERLEERSDAFAKNASSSELDAWMARRAQDDLIAALEDNALLSEAQPKGEADAIQLLLQAREIAPTDAAVLKGICDIEHVFSQRPDLKDAMLGVSRSAADLLSSNWHRHQSNRHSTEERESET